MGYFWLKSWFIIRRIIIKIGLGKKLKWCLCGDKIPKHDRNKEGKCWICIELGVYND